MFFKKMLRTMKVYKVQFISMIIMIAIGVGVFVGFNMEWVTIKENTDYFFEKTSFADYRIVSEEGFSKKDLDKISKLEGVERAGRFFSTNVEVKGKEKDALALTVTENKDISGFIVTKGQPYDQESEDGIWLSDKYAEENNISVGNRLTITYLGKDIEGKVQGLIKSGEYTICMRDETKIMPDYTEFGFAYISPVMYEKQSPYPFYSQINVLSKCEKKEFSDKVDKAMGKTMMILDKEENINYKGSRGEMNEGKTMATVLPVIFLAIAVLTMVTTMHRITTKEKVQIGTFKALGFKDKKILHNYMLYTLFTGLVGILLGVIFGYLLAGYIMNPDGEMMGLYLDMIKWDLVMPNFCYIVLVVIFIILIMVGYFSTKKMLMGTVAETLEPYIPEEMKSLCIEKTTWFQKRSYITRWNIRDIMRHKARTIMSFIGVFGCTVILVASFGIKDTMGNFIDEYYESSVNYENRIYLQDDVSEEKTKEIIDKYDGEFSASQSVKLNDKPISLEIQSFDKGMNSLIGTKGKIKDIDNDGTYICQRLSDKYNVQKGDNITVSPYGSDEEYTLNIAGVIRSLEEGIVITPKYAEQLEIPYKIDSVYTNAKKGEIYKSDAISTISSRNSLLKTFEKLFSMMNIMILALVICGVVLGIIVLYNLGTMSYMERYRELATLKVVGFKEKQIGKLLIQQNIWIAIMGAVPGIPMGYLVLSYLMKLLAAEYEMKTVILPHSYIFALILIFGISLLVSYMLARKNKKVDMVEALKGTE